MFFENELPMNHEPSLDYMAKERATISSLFLSLIRESRCSNISTSFDFEYERAWSDIEHDLEQDGLEWEKNNSY